MQFRVRPDSELGAALDWGAAARRCAIGRSGIGLKQSEGDGITPVGSWAIRRVFYRPDRIAKPRTSLPVRTINLDDAWCDASDNLNYNRLVRLPCSASHEELWRDDRLYDVMAVLGFNDDPVVPGLGSAIFLHVAQPDYSATEGCIALALPDLIDVLRVATPGSAICVVAA